MSNTKYSPRLLEIVTACDLLYQGLKGTAYQEEMEYVILQELLDIGKLTVPIDKMQYERVFHEG